MSDTAAWLHLGALRAQAAEAAIAYSEACRKLRQQLVWLHEHDGVPVPKLAGWLGVSRQQVYRLMRER